VGIAVNAGLARSVFIGTIEATHSELLQQEQYKHIPVLCILTVQNSLSSQLNWTFRAATKASQKLPTNWEEQWEMTFFRLVYAIASSNIHPSLVINADRTMIHLVPGGNQRTYEQKGSKQVSMHALEEKRGFTSLLAVTSEGLVLGTQSIWRGKTEKSLPKLHIRAAAEDQGHIFSFNPSSHWSSLKTMQEFFELILKPHPERMINRYQLPHFAKCVIYFDCWRVHRRTDMLYWLRHQYEWLVVIFVPAGCTGLFQPCDVGLQRVYKHHICRSASNFFTAEVRNQLESGTSSADVKLSTTLPSLRDATVSWVVHAVDHLNNPVQKTLCLKAWSNCHVKGWNLSWECLTSALASAAFMQKTEDYQLAVKGSYAPGKEEPSENLDDIETPPNELEKEETEFEDDVDILLDIIHIAACIPPESSKSPCYSSVSASYKQRGFNETLEDDLENRNEVSIANVPKGYHRCLRSQVPISYLESDTEEGDDDEEELNGDGQQMAKDLGAERGEVTVVWLNLKSSARTGGVKGGPAGRPCTLDL